MNISDIAHMAGVSTATVSRVLNNSQLVKPDTKEKVLQVIEESGYTPSAVAKSLSVRATHNVGVCFADIENAFFSGALKGITEVAEKNGYNVFFFNTDETNWREHNYLRVMREQRLDGVIISPVDCNDATTLNVLQDYEKNGIPVVLFDRELLDGSFSSVVADNGAATYGAIMQLIGNGHERIALIEGKSSNLPVRQRALGYRQAMEDAGIPLRPEYMLRADQKSELAYWATKKLLGLDRPPTAIFTCNNHMTLGCIRYLTEQGIVPGRDVSLIGFDEIEELRLIDYNLSVVTRSETQMGRLAMELLLERLRAPEEPVRSVTVPAYLILRGSEKLESPEQSSSPMQESVRKFLRNGG